MATIIVRLDPRRLTNPDVDIRYRLPDLLAEQSGGVISDDGYDYTKDGFMLIFLEASQLEPAIACVLGVIQSVRVLGNDLRHAAVVAQQDAGECKVIYPPDFTEPFRLD